MPRRTGQVETGRKVCADRPGDCGFPQVSGRLVGVGAASSERNMAGGTDRHCVGAVAPAKASQIQELRLRRREQPNAQPDCGSSRKIFGKSLRCEPKCHSSPTDRNGRRGEPSVGAGGRPAVGLPRKLRAHRSADRRYHGGNSMGTPTSVATVIFRSQLMQFDLMPVVPRDWNIFSQNV